MHNLCLQSQLFQRIEKFYHQHGHFVSNDTQTDAFESTRHDFVLEGIDRLKALTTQISMHLWSLGQLFACCFVCQSATNWQAIKLTSAMHSFTPNSPKMNIFTSHCPKDLKVQKGTRQGFETPSFIVWFGPGPTLLGEPPERGTHQSGFAPKC